MPISLFISHSGLFPLMFLMWSVPCIQFPCMCGPFLVSPVTFCFVYTYANYSLSLSVHIFRQIFLNLEIYPSMLQPWGFNLLRWSYFSPLRFPILETSSSRTWFLAFSPGSVLQIHDIYFYCHTSGFEFLLNFWHLWFTFLIYYC